MVFLLLVMRFAKSNKPPPLPPPTLNTVVVIVFPVVYAQAWEVLKP